MRIPGVEIVRTLRVEIVNTTLRPLPIIHSSVVQISSAEHAKHNFANWVESVIYVHISYGKLTVLP